MVPQFTWYNAMKAAPTDEDWNLELSNYTLEWWSKMTGRNGVGGYTKNNQAIFNSGRSWHRIVYSFWGLDLFEW